MPALSKFGDGETLMWLCGEVADDVVSFSHEIGDFAKSSPAKTLAVELGEVNAASATWK